MADDRSDIATEPTEASVDAPLEEERDLSAIEALHDEETLAEFIERGSRLNSRILTVVMILLVFVVALGASLIMYVRDTSTGVPLTRHERDLVAARAFRDANPSMPDAWSRVALAQEAAGEVDASLRTIDEGIIETGDSLLLSTQGDILRRARRYPEALSAYNRALAYFEQTTEQTPALDPDDNLYLGSVYHGRGLVHIATDEVEAGIADLELSVQHAPRLADAWAALGDAYLLTGDTERASDAYGTALRFVPDHPAALSGLNRIGG